MQQRQTYKLDDAEWERFKNLKPIEYIFDFWRDVAHSRGLDYKTVLTVTGNPRQFTALPYGHGQHWCWPHELVIKGGTSDKPMVQRSSTVEPPAVNRVVAGSKPAAGAKTSKRAGMLTSIGFLKRKG